MNADQLFKLVNSVFSAVIRLCEVRVSSFIILENGEYRVIFDGVFKYTASAPHARYSRSDELRECHLELPVFISADYPTGLGILILLDIPFLHHNQ